MPKERLPRLPAECLQLAGSTETVPSHCTELLGEEHAESFPARTDATASSADDQREDDGDDEDEEDKEDEEGEEEAGGGSGHEDDMDAPTTTVGRRRLGEGSPSPASAEGQPPRSRVASVSPPVVLGGGERGGSDAQRNIMFEEVARSEEEADSGGKRRRRLQSGPVDGSVEYDDDREADAYGDDYDDDGSLVGTGAARANERKREEGVAVSVGSGSGSPAGFPFEVSMPEPSNERRFQLVPFRAITIQAENASPTISPYSPLILHSAIMNMERCFDHVRREILTKKGLGGERIKQG